MDACWCNGIGSGQSTIGHSLTTMKEGSSILVVEVDMATKDNPAETERVACDVCLKEVPITEAVVPEATDYVAHFCGLECYEKWRKTLPATPDDQEEKLGS